MKQAYGYMTVCFGGWAKNVNLNESIQNSKKNGGFGKKATKLLVYVFSNEQTFKSAFVDGYGSANWGGNDMEGQNEVLRLELNA